MGSTSNDANYRHQLSFGRGNLNSAPQGCTFQMYQTRRILQGDKFDLELEKGIFFSYRSLSPAKNLHLTSGYRGAVLHALRVHFFSFLVDFFIAF